MGQQTTNSKPSSVDPTGWLDQHGNWLYRYAILRVHDGHLAEDLVQETLLAAVHARENYSGDASERTWLTAILRNKILGHYRQRSVRVVEQQGAADPAHDIFDRGGTWMQKPVDWGPRPQENLEREEFWAVLRRCLANLPPKLRDVYVLRELDGLDTEKICEDLSISANNLWTRLHRARLLLRECLERHWFADNSRKH